MSPVSLNVQKDRKRRDHGIPCTRAGWQKRTRRAPRAGSSRGNMSQGRLRGPLSHNGQEFMEGKSLDRVISPLPDIFLQEKVIRDWAMQLYDIFDYLHSREEGPVIYRDLKPSNVIKDPAGRIHLLDFGIARVYHEGKDRDTEVMGSTLTASPEHYGRGQTDVRSDIFTLGATLHFIATNGRGRGEIPFQFDPVRSVNPRLSPLLEQVLQKALELEPSQRFQSMKEMRRAHTEKKEMPPSREPVLPGPQAGAPGEETANTAPPPPAYIWLIGALCAITVVLGGMVVYNSTHEAMPVSTPPPAAGGSPLGGEPYRIRNDSWPHPETGSSGKPVKPGSHVSPAKATPADTAESPSPPATGSGETTGPAETPLAGLLVPDQTGVPSPVLTTAAPVPSTPPVSPAASRKAPELSPAAEHDDTPVMSPAATAAFSPGPTTDPVAIHPQAPGTPRSGETPGLMPSVGSVVDSDVSVPEHSFQVRIPHYRRDPPGHDEVMDNDTTVYSFSRQGSGENGDRFLKIIILRAPMTIASRHVKNIYYNRLREIGAREIEPLAEYGGCYRGIFTVTRGFDSGMGEYTCEQRLLIGRDGRVLYILMAACPAGERSRNTAESEFGTFFHSFTLR